MGWEHDMRNGHETGERVRFRKMNEREEKWKPDSEPYQAHVGIGWCCVCCRLGEGP